MPRSVANDNAIVNSAKRPDSTWSVTPPLFQPERSGGTTAKPVVHGAADYGLRAPLGPGEAACVAIASERDWTIVTDDDAALTVLDQLHGGRTYAYERICRLLIRAANEKRITPGRANEIHAEMRDLGFWDSGTPFPGS